MSNKKIFQYKAPNIFRRVLVIMWLLCGFKRHDFNAARSWTDRNYGTSVGIVKLFRFIGWATKTMLVTIPNAMVGVTFAKPVSTVSHWIASGNPIENHPWTSNPRSNLPENSEVIVIGAGFTGAASAYHWSKHGVGSMIVLEMNEAASGASGRNEGVVVMGRFFSYVKEMMLDDLLKTRPDLTPTQRITLAQQFAGQYVKAAYINADMIEQTIEKENYEVDYKRVGWVQNFDDRQDYIDESVRESADFGFDDWTKLSPKDVREITGIQATKNNGFSKAAGTWNPAKWVWALLSTAILSDKVSFFSNTRVCAVEDQGTTYAVRTTRGTIHTKYVINATESYTANLHPQFIDKLWPLQTQAAFAEGGPSAIKPGVAMGGSNSWFGKDKHGIFMGSDGTRIHHTRAGYINPSRFITKHIISEIHDSFGHSSMHVSREWSCTAGFTKDEYPIIGLIDGKRQYIIAGMCGSGSSVHFNGARHVIHKILGIQGRDDYPEEFFSPTRILSPASHKWPSLDDQI